MAKNAASVSVPVTTASLICIAEAGSADSRTGEDAGATGRLVTLLGGNLLLASYEWCRIGCGQAQLIDLGRPSVRFTR